MKIKYRLIKKKKRKKKKTTGLRRLNLAESKKKTFCSFRCFRIVNLDKYLDLPKLLRIKSKLFKYIYIYKYIYCYIKVVIVTIIIRTLGTILKKAWNLLTSERESAPIVMYCPSTEQSIKRYTCVKKRKNSGSRWTLNNNITSAVS